MIMNSGKNWKEPEHLDAISKELNTVEVRRNYLISCVTVPSAKIYTPDQLRQIFDLTWK